MGELTAGFSPYLTNLPLSVLRQSINYSPYKAIAEIRRSQKRVATKNKNESINSLVVFKTKNESFHFFHQMDSFIFLELPKQHIALFHFYKKKFANNVDAYEEALKVIKTFY